MQTLPSAKKWVKRGKQARLAHKKQAIKDGIGRRLGIKSVSENVE